MMPAEWCKSCSWWLSQTINIPQHPVKSVKEKAIESRGLINVIHPAQALLMMWGTPLCSGLCKSGKKAKNPSQAAEGNHASSGRRHRFVASTHTPPYFFNKYSLRMSDSAAGGMRPSPKASGMKSLQLRHETNLHADLNHTKKQWGKYP